MRTAASLALSLASTILLAQSVDVPLTNWTVPTYRAASASDGLTTMADGTPGVGFVGIQPCRVADTRGNGAPIQGGIFPNSGLRTWDLTGLCGIPAGTDAISANFTMVAAGGIPAGSFLLAWPTGQAPPPTAIMTYGPGQIISNAAIVQLGAGEQLNVNVSGSTHIVMDVNGYFTDQYNAGVSFHAVSSNVAPAILGDNTSSLGFAVGVLGRITSTTTSSGSAGVRGMNAGTGPSGVGVWGSHAGGGWGVFGEASTGYGVVGKATATSGVSNGVFGMTSSFDTGSNGVLGIYSADPRNAVVGYTAGVRGVATSGYGVVGESNLIGVIGVRLLNGLLQTGGWLGYNSTDGIFSQGNLSVSGTKSFVEPHPTDPASEIAYVALEGPEAGTYFRGQGRLQNGLAEIAVPESFRMVTDPEGLSVQVTPIAEMATVAVVSIDLNRIVVKGSRDVSFYYTVNGLRQAYRGWEAVRENAHYLPEGPNARMPLSLAPEQRRRLIATGIYKEDGTVNLETARKLGWEKEWEKRNQTVARSTPE